MAMTRGHATSLRSQIQTAMSKPVSSQADRSWSSEILSKRVWPYEPEWRRRRSWPLPATRRVHRADHRPTASLDQPPRSPECRRALATRVPRTSLACDPPSLLHLVRPALNVVVGDWLRKTEPGKSRLTMDRLKQVAELVVERSR